MASPQFIELASHPGIVLNVSQIVVIEQTAVALSEGQRKLYKGSGALHAITISMVGGKSIELKFESEEACAATLKMIRIAIKPFAVQEPAVIKAGKAGSLRTGKRTSDT